MPHETIIYIIDEMKARFVVNEESHKFKKRTIRTKGFNQPNMLSRFEH